MIGVKNMFSRVPKGMLSELMGLRALVQSDVLEIPDTKKDSAFRSQWLVSSVHIGTSVLPFRSGPKRDFDIVSLTFSGEYRCTCRGTDCIHITAVRSAG